MGKFALKLLASLAMAIAMAHGSVPLPLGFWKPATVAATSDPTLTITNGLIGWWESAAITGQSDGGTLTNWTDLSGNGRDASGGGATAPLYKTNIFGSKPAVRFDGVNDELGFTHTAVTNFTVVVAWQLKSIGSWGFGPVRWRPGTSGGPGFELDGDTSSTSNPIKHLVVWNAAGTEIANKKGPDESLSLPGTPRVKAIDTWRWDGTTCTMRLNGAAQTVANGAGSGYGHSGVDSIGGSYGFPGGDVAAVLVYDTNLSDGDILTVESYLNTKYPCY